MTTASHNTHIDAKRRMRVEVPDAGKIYVPFCGFGEVSNYPDERIIGCDYDRDAVEHWRRERPTAKIECVDACKFSFPDEAIGMGDFDAFGAPWKAISHFLRNARRAETCVLVITDGSIQKSMRSRRPFDFAKLHMGAISSLDAKRYVKQWPLDAMEWIRKDYGAEVKLNDSFTSGMTYYCRLDVIGGTRGGGFGGEAVDLFLLPTDLGGLLD